MKNLSRGVRRELRKQQRRECRIVNWRGKVKGTSVLPGVSS